MSFKATLYIFEKEYPLLDLDYNLIQNTDDTGRPNSRVHGGKINVSVQATKDDSGIEGTMISATQMVEGKIVVYKRDGMQKDFEIKFANTYLSFLKYRFNHQSTDNLVMDITFSALIMEIRNSIYESPVNPNNPFSQENIPVTVKETPQTTITRIVWMNADDQEEGISEIGITQKASLFAEINNPEGSTVNITIEKEDGTEFENGKKQLLFTETVSHDGRVEISPFEIKEQWEEFKTADIDKLIAKVEHNGVSKKSNPLQIIPKPKATLHFRPHSGWSGEFGFDWMRIEDTSIDGDVDYEQNVGEYGTVYATQPGAVFTPKDYSVLENEYNPTNINNRKDAAGNPIQYYTPWLTIYRKPNVVNAPYAELELLTEVDVQPDELYIEFPKKHFDITGAIDDPNDATLKHYKLGAAMMGVTSTGNPNKTTIQLQCIHTLSKDETIKVWAAKKKTNGTLDTPVLSGMLKVRANNKINRRVSKIVFVNVITNINGLRNPVNGIIAANTTTQENYLSPFLKQALIRSDVENENLDLFDASLPEVQTLNTDYTLARGRNKIFNKYSNSGGTSLVNFLTQKFNAKPAFTKYANYYKVFFLGEAGGRMNGRNIVGLGGHANGIPSKECVMYANPMPFFVAHELMHCMGLYHSFDNNGTHTFKIGQTENIMDYSHVARYATPNGTLTQISTWKWQWEILKNSNENET
ncbi:type VI secretion system tube protein TssD [uncultured Aquimarina sp.]|uniref:type VI secretion system tube protein TssD n=1 Tax=uncultured Aquimarina sp. TaxID=575652 RepID=UPI00262C31D4|nr:type VI secretion system tube protein TssD [uncultured Aquimarina sp.]